MSQLIITAVGPDRPGIVGELTALMHASGGNILDSRMVNLRGEFAMMILVELPDSAAAERMAASLEQRGGSMGLRLSLVPQDPSALRAPKGGLPYRLKTYSMDQPGILARISAVLQSLGVNIEELEARQESAPFAGSPLFSTEMRLTVPPDVPLGQLRQRLEAAGNELNCDIDLDPGDG
jgi:glycine cleavage system transcriptional repressor